MVTTLKGLSNGSKMIFYLPYTHIHHFPQVALTDSGGSYGAGLSAETLPMHGLGYGLPLSRLYARYFKGDIQIASVDGYRTDV